MLFYAFSIFFIINTSKPEFILFRLQLLCIVENSKILAYAQTMNKVKLKAQKQPVNTILSVNCGSNPSAVGFFEMKMTKSR